MKFYKNFIIYWSIIYLTLAFLGRFTTEHKEYFPFFRWSLYSKTPNTLEHYFVIVERIGDSILPTPTDLRYLESYHKLNSVDVNLLVQNSSADFLSEDKILNRKFFKIIPLTSKFDIYLTRMDLSQEDYEASKESFKVLNYNNQSITFE